jgi:hypothetical protein
MACTFEPLRGALLHVRRRRLILAALAQSGLACTSANAADLLAQLTNQDAGSGLRAALERGAGASRCRTGCRRVKA